MGRLLDYPVIDGDQHFREPPGAVKTYLEPRWARRPPAGDSPWDFWLGRMGYRLAV